MRTTMRTHTIKTHMLHATRRGRTGRPQQASTTLHHTRDERERRDSRDRARAHTQHTSHVERRDLVTLRYRLRTIIKAQRHGTQRANLEPLSLTRCVLQVEERANLRVRTNDTPADKVEEGEGGREDCELHGFLVFDQPVSKVCGLQNLLVALLGD